MNDPRQVRVFRQTLDILVEADSYEEAQELFRAEVGWGVNSNYCDVVFEEIYGFPGDHEPVRDSYRGVPLYPAQATMAVLTKSRKKAEEALASLVGSVTFELGAPELFFEAIEPGPAEAGTLTPPRWVKPPRVSHPQRTR